jgi:hypothetical protein
MNELPMDKTSTYSDIALDPAARRARRRRALIPAMLFLILTLFDGAVELVTYKQIKYAMSIASRAATPVEQGEVIVTNDPVAQRVSARPASFCMSSRHVQPKIPAL